MTRIRGWLAVLAVLLVAACGGDGPDSGTLTIENNSGVTIAIVNFSDCGDPEWGPDQLDPDEFIEDGESRSWDVDVGCYDIRVIFVGGAEQENFDQEIEQGDDFIWTVD